MLQTIKCKIHLKKYALIISIAKKFSIDGKLVAYSITNLIQKIIDLSVQYKINKK